MGRSIVQDDEIELGQPFRVGEDVKLDDLVVLDRDAENGVDPAFRSDDDAGSAGSGDVRQIGERERGPATSRRVPAARAVKRAVVGPEDDVWVERFEQRWGRPM